MRPCGSHGSATCEWVAVVREQLWGEDVKPSSCLTKRAIGSEVQAEYILTISCCLCTYVSAVLGFLDLACSFIVRAGHVEDQSLVRRRGGRSEERRVGKECPV